jgi:hypothetical protein
MQGRDVAHRDWGDATVPHAAPDAVFDFPRVCRHGFQLKFGVRLPVRREGSSDGRLRAVYTRIQAASPPPSRDGLDWEFGIRVNDDTENGQPLRTADGDDSWKRHGVFYLEDAPSLDQPAPDTIVLDRWLAVPAVQAIPTTVAFTDKVDQRGFLSGSYPQPLVRDGRVTPVPVDFYGEYELRWSEPLQAGTWVAISFDRFWPPERRSAEYIAQVGDCKPPHE